MFEQTFVDGVGKTNKSWTVMVSFLLQIGLIVVAVILPLIYTEVLPTATLASMLTAPPPPPPSSSSSGRRGSRQSGQGNPSPVRRRQTDGAEGGPQGYRSH